MPNIVNRDEVRKLIEADDVVVLEALPASDYESGHLPGARNMPHDQVDELAAGLVPDKDTPVVVYCAGGTCENSAIAARRLEQLGYTNVADYAPGKPDWSEAGLPLETD
jgi:rhodanese-related sulfurtransferase